MRAAGGSAGRAPFVISRASAPSHNDHDTQRKGKESIQRKTEGGLSFQEKEKEEKKKSPY